MPIRVSPLEPNPTHHFALKDRSGTVIGLTACDGAGKSYNFHNENLYTKNPVNTTAFKQTSGNSGYDIFEYPYNPVVQDDLSGGRGNMDFERDSTKYFDAFRTASGRANKAYAGPLEQYVIGDHRQVIQSMPGSVQWIKMTEENRYLYKRFQSTESMTAAQIWLNLRRLGVPDNLTMAIYSDNSGVVDTELDSIAIPYDATADILMEWVQGAISQAVTSGTYYWLVVYAGSTDNDSKHWKIAVQSGLDTTYTSSTFTTAPSAANFDIYYRVLDADSEKTCIPFEYKEMQYFVISGASGAPKLYMAGYRGAADANMGQLNKLIDATQSWTADELIGSVVMVTDGTGKLEPQPWRTITDNGTGDVTVDSDWTIEHTTSTEYVIFSPVVNEITGHGLTAPVTDVLVSPKGVVYFCMGDAVTVRRLREYNDAGTWRNFSDATNCQADETSTTKAVFMKYKPQAQVIVIGNNSDASGNVSVTLSTNLPDWGTALTWDTAKPVDNKYRRINGMIVHPDASGNEAVWILKTDMPFILGGGNPYPAGSDEFRNVRSLANGVNPLRHDVYLYFPLLEAGLQRYYGGTYTDMGPNLGEGLPKNRRGPIVDMLGYPGKSFIAINAGEAGYSSIMQSGGWHEMYRAPKGQQIKRLAFQVIPGTALDRMWVYQGNDLLWLPFASNANELKDNLYEYVPEFAVELSRMHAGMYDVQKMIRYLKLQTENLESDEQGQPVCFFEVDYKKDGDTAWTSLDVTFSISPTQTVDFADVYGLAGKQLNLRVRGYSTDKNKTPVMLAILLFTVMRVDVKAIYGAVDVLCEDNESIGLREEEKALSAADKLKILEDWGDASNDSMLHLSSLSSLLHDKKVFLNVGTRRQVRFKNPDGSGSDAYVVSVSWQDA